MKENFIKNIYYILEEDEVTKKQFKNKDLLKKVLRDKKTFNFLFKKFTYEFNNLFEKDDLLMKTEDFIFRLNLLINEVLKPKCYTKIEDIRETIIENDFDLYSAIDCNDNMDVIEEFISELNETGVRI